MGFLRMRRKDLMQDETTRVTRNKKKLEMIEEKEDDEGKV